MLQTIENAPSIQNYIQKNPNPIEITYLLTNHKKEYNN